MTDRAALANALHQMESSGRSTSRTSVDGARGGMQIMPETFKRFADPGMNPDNPAHSFEVGARIINHLADLTGDDPLRVAVGYFSGEGNIAPPNSPTPWKRDTKDGNGTRTSQYVAKYIQYLNGQSGTDTLDAGDSNFSDDEVQWENTTEQDIPATTGISDDFKEGEVEWEDAPSSQPLGLPPGSITPNTHDPILTTGDLKPIPDKTTLYERFGTGAADRVHGLNQRIYALLQEFVPTLKDPRLSRQALWGDPRNELDKRTDAFQNAPSPLEVIGDSYAQKLKAREANYQARRGENANTFDPTRMVGNIAIEAPMAAMPLANTYKGAALLGALSSSLNPDAPSTPTMLGDFGSLGNTVGTLSGGAIAGFGGQKLSDLAGSVVGGFKPTEEAARLRAQGIKLTPPQALGGMAAKVEETLSVLPIFGEAQNIAKSRGKDTLNRVVWDKVLSPIGEKSTAKLGRQAVEEAYKKIAGEYNSLLSHLVFHPTESLNKGLAAIRQEVSLIPNPARRKVFADLITNYIDTPLNTSGLNAMDGPTLNAALKRIGEEGAKYAKGASRTVEDEALGKALWKVNNLLMDTLEEVNPEDAGALRAVREAWANFRVARKASTNADKAVGEFDASQLQRAVKSEASNDYAYAQGAGRFQQLADDAVVSLANTTNLKPGNRYLWTGLLSGLVGASVSPTIAPFTGAAVGTLGMGAAGYMRSPQAAFNAALFDRPELLKAAGQGVQALAPVGALTGSNLLSNYAR